MFSGKSVPVKMRVKSSAIGDVIDWFGDDIAVTPESDDWCTVHLHANENAMFYWSLQYGMFVEILEPDELRTREIEALTKIQNMYSVQVHP